MQLIRAITLDELPNSDKSSLTTKSRYILSDVQQASN